MIDFERAVSSEMKEFTEMIDAGAVRKDGCPLLCRWCEGSHFKYVPTDITSGHVFQAKHVCEGCGTTAAFECMGEIEPNTYGEMVYREQNNR